MTSPSRPIRSWRRRFGEGGLAVSLLAPVCLGAQDRAQRSSVIPATTAGVEYRYAYFHGDIDPWHLIAMSVGHRRDAGALVGRVNVANQFATWGTQYEAEAYAAIGARTFAYLNGGYSSSFIFPEWRFGGEVFQSLHRAYEASLGVRHLRFMGPNATLYTGSITRTAGNYWVSVRPYLQDKQGLSGSGTMIVRRYYAAPDSYVGARIGMGSTTSDEFTADQLTRTSSVMLGVHGSRTRSTHTILTGSFAFEREHLILDRARNKWEVGGGVKYRF